MSRNWTDSGPISHWEVHMMEEKGLVSVLFRRCTMEQKIKQSGIQIGRNIRRIRLTRGIGQTELVRMIQLHDVDMTRETLVKIERGIQHITGSQLRGLRDCLNTTYDELLKWEKALRVQGFFVIPKNRKQALKMHFSGRIIKSVMPYRKNHPFFDKVFIDFSPAVIYNNKDMQDYMYI